MAFSYVDHGQSDRTFSPIEPPRHQLLSSGPTLPSVSLAPSGVGSPWLAEFEGNRFNQHAAQSHTVPPGYVPAEVANKRLWAVTTEYENLLRLQKEHQLLTGQRREKEINHLRAVTEMLTGEAHEDDAISARLAARDQEVTATQKAKQAELELLGAVLVLRDRQITDLQRMCESKRRQISQLQQHKTPIDAQKGDAWKDVQQLREHILGMESAVGDKRSELQSLAETLDARTRRLEALQAEVADAEEQVRQMAGGPVPMQKLDVQVSPHAQKLQIEAGSGASSGALPTRVEAMQQQLAQAQQALKHMVQANVENDSIVRGIAGKSPDSQVSREEDLGKSSSAPYPESNRIGDAPPIWSSALGHLGIPSLPSSPNSLGVQGGSLPSRHSHELQQQMPPRQLDEKFTRQSREHHQPTSSHLHQPQTSQNVLAADTAAELISAPTLEKPMETSSSDPLPSPSNSIPTSTSPVATGSRVRSQTPPRPAIDEPWHLYQPHLGDAVDAMVADFVNQPRNRLRRSLFCRTGFGEYLYGTRKVRLRISSGSARLEGCEAAEEIGIDTPMDWAPIEEFTRRLERAQSDNLQRARERVRAGVIGMM
mmetsp:Transcript_25920/g.41635  ORF Transcript_25920/g.41635 Transcript_25920/m.41635 type:complete len:596 (+) Transcript_25920:36-1823(+)